MQKLGKRVLYHDTDSIIFSVKDGEYVPPLGTYLGQLTDELTCKELGCKKQGCSGHCIEEFVSCGPKNYSFRVNTGEIVCKVRGFSLNYKSSLILNFESMKEALVAWKRNEKKELVTVKTELVRDKYKPKVFNRVISKHYGVVYDKRKVLVCSSRLGVTGVIDMGIQVIQTMFTEAFMQRLHCNPCIPTSITPVTPNLVPPVSVY